MEAWDGPFSARYYRPYRRKIGREQLRVRDGSAAAARGKGRERRSVPAVS